MAKIKAIDPGRGELRAIEQRVVLRSTKHGMVAQAWPKKRGKAKSFAQLWYQKQFAYAGQWSNQSDALQYETAVNWVKGTDMVPRDVLTQNAYGRGQEIFGPDGFQWAHNPHSPPGVHSMTPKIQGTQTYKNANTSLPSMTLTYVPWDLETINNGGFWDPSDPTKFTCPSNGALVLAQAVIRTTAITGGWISAVWYLNRTNVKGAIIMDNSITRSVSLPTALIPMAAGDVLEVGVVPQYNATLQGSVDTYASVLLFQLA